MSSKRAKRRRQMVRAEAPQVLEPLTVEQLVNLRHEIGREMSLQSVVVNELRLRLETMRAEIDRRKVLTPAGIHISDHALVRYLQRVKGMDVEALRAEVGEMARRARKTVPGKNGRCLDETTGFTIGVDEDVTTVTTVFDNGKLPVMQV